MDTSQVALEALQEALRFKKQEEQELEMAIRAIYRERELTCNHPGEAKAFGPSEWECPHCHWIRESCF